MFTVIIPFYDGHETINRLVESIPQHIQILIVDDHSKRPLESLDYPNVKILRGKEKGYFAGAVNIGLTNTRGDVLILNQDTYFTGDGWLKQLQAGLEDGYSYIGERIKGTRADWPNGYIHGTYMYLTRELIQETGLLNQELFPMWGCTAEYQLRAARNNFKILPLTHVEDFVHLREEGQQFGKSFAKLVQEEEYNKSLFVSTPPLVSVIIPVHNFSKWLHSTVNSLVGGMTDMGMWKQQTFGAFEVVIVDDSSTDDTPDVLKEVCDPWKGVRSIRLNRPRGEVWDDIRDKYIGKVVALNAGIAASFGQYVMVLDADDMVKEDRIEVFYKKQIENPHGFVYDNLQFFGHGEILDFTFPDEAIEIHEGGAVTRGPHPRAGETTKHPKLDNYNFETLIYKNHVHNSIMFPKKAWKEIGGYPSRFIYGREDWAIAVKLGVHGWCGHKVGGYHGLLYRREGQNRTLENTRPNWMKYFQSQMVKEFPEIYRGVRPMACCGRGASSNTSRNQAFAAGQARNIGAEGTTILNYIGGRAGGASFNVWGFATGTQYRITPGKQVRVDNRDLMDNSNQKNGILQIVEFGKNIFEVVPEPDRVVAQPATPTITQEAVVIQEAQDEVALDTSVLDSTVAVFQQALADNDYTVDELQLLLVYERANKNRITVIRTLDERINV